MFVSFHGLPLQANGGAFFCAVYRCELLFTDVNSRQPFLSPPTPHTPRTAAVPAVLRLPQAQHMPIIGAVLAAAGSAAFATTPLRTPIHPPHAQTAVGCSHL